MIFSLLPNTVLIKPDYHDFNKFKDN